MNWRERLREINESPWCPVSPAALVGASIILALILWAANTGDRWV